MRKPSDYKTLFRQAVVASAASLVTTLAVVNIAKTEEVASSVPTTIRSYNGHMSISQGGLTLHEEETGLLGIMQSTEFGVDKSVKAKVTLVKAAQEACSKNTVFKYPQETSEPVTSGAIDRFCGLVKAGKFDRSVPT